MRPFRPLPFLGNPHVQTVLGNLLPAPAVAWPSRLRLVALPEGDRLVVHENTPARWQPGRPIALLVHGLGGSHHSAYMRRLANGFLHRSVRVGRLDLRGAGA